MGVQLDEVMRQVEGIDKRPPREIFGSYTGPLVLKGIPPLPYALHPLAAKPFTPCLDLRKVIRYKTEVLANFTVLFRH